jgi:hypothetical protein
MAAIGNYCEGVVGAGGVFEVGFGADLTVPGAEIEIALEHVGPKSGLFPRTEHEGDRLGGDTEEPRKK